MNESASQYVCNAAICQSVKCELHSLLRSIVAHVMFSKFGFVSLDDRSDAWRRRRRRRRIAAAKLCTVDESLTYLPRQFPTKKFRLHSPDIFPLSRADKADDITHTHRQTHTKTKPAAWNQGSALRCSLSKTRLLKNNFLLSKKKKEKRNN